MFQLNVRPMAIVISVAVMGSAVSFPRVIRADGAGCPPGYIGVGPFIPGAGDQPAHRVCKPLPIPTPKPTRTPSVPTAYTPKPGASHAPAPTPTPTPRPFYPPPKCPTRFWAVYNARHTAVIRFMCPIPIQRLMHK